MSLALPQKVIDQMKKAGLPTDGTQPFRPRLVKNRKGEEVIEKREISFGPKEGKRGYVDEQGRVWIKDRAHGDAPDHWDVQLEEGEGYIRIGLDGNPLT